MSIRRKLLLISGLFLSVFVISAVALAVSENTAAVPISEPKTRQLNPEFQPLGASPVIEVNAGEVPQTSARATVCDGEWMGVPRYSLNSWFTGGEYYATYQNPIETGCPALTTYPFEVQNVMWHVFNPGATNLVIDIQPVIYTSENLSPTCARPGEICCYGPTYTVTIVPGSVLITLPIDCCVYGPYFAGVLAPDFIGTGLLGIVTDSAGTGGTFGASRACGNYNNYQGLWEDLIVAYGFPGNIRLWSDGNASDANSCDLCAYDVEPGVDLWTSPPDVSFDNHFSAFPIPNDFFDLGSDPFGGSVCLEGSPLTPVAPGTLGATDAIVRRLDRASLPTVGSADVVPIELIALSLVSCNPITVTYGGGSSPELWNVRVTLSSNLPQQIGQMTIRKDCCNGGTFTSTLPVTPKFVFTRVSDLAQRVLDLGGFLPPIMFSTTGGHWSHEVKSPFDLVTSPGLIRLDNDLSLLTPLITIPPSSKFTPGMRTLPCSPSSPLDPYCQGKILTREQEALAQHGVLPPQENTPIEGACCLPDGSCIVTTPACCLTLGGTYLGDFVPCPLDCTPDTLYDSLCTAADIVITLNPGDPGCTTPVAPALTFAQMPGFPTVVCRTPGPPYIPGQVIQTELIAMTLQGTHPSLGAIRLRENTPAPSTGFVTVTNINAAGNMTLGESFFDVFVEVDLPSSGGTYFNPNPIRMYSQITALEPPIGTAYQMISGPSQLLTLPAGPPIGFLCSAVHRVVSCGCCVGLRGSPNGDANEANILDLTFAVDRIFRGGPPAACFEEGNPNGDLNSLNILDLTYFVDRIFRGGPPPVPCP